MKEAVPYRFGAQILKTGVVLLFLIFGSSLVKAQTRTPSQEEKLTWKNCGTNCGASAGSGADAYGTQTLVSSINLDGVSSQFALDPKDPYGNFYWYASLPTPASPTAVD